MNFEGTYQPIKLNEFEDSDANKILAKLEKHELPEITDLVPNMDVEHYTIAELRQTLLDEPFEQFNVEPSRVKALLVGAANVPGIVEAGLLTPIIVGLTSDGRVSIMGGRNRLVALLTAYHLNGYDVDSDEFNAQTIPVIVMPYRDEAVIALNKSRTVTQTEVVTMKAQVRDVDVNNFDSIVEAYKEKVLPTGDFFKLAALLAYREADQKPGLVNELTLDTVGKIYGSLATQFYKPENRGSEYKHGKSNREFNMTLLGEALSGEVAFGRLNDVLEKLNSEGLTTFSRSSTLIARDLSRYVKSFVEPPIKEVQKEALDALEREEKPKRKSRKKTADAAELDTELELIM